MHQINHNACNTAHDEKKKIEKFQRGGLHCIFQDTLMYINTLCPSFSVSIFTKSRYNNLLKYLIHLCVM